MTFDELNKKHFAKVYLAISYSGHKARLRASETRLLGARLPWIKAETRTPRRAIFYVNIETDEVVSEGAIREARFLAHRLATRTSSKTENGEGRTDD